eukprot:2195525-Rhodomonas_salina.1
MLSLKSGIGVVVHPPACLVRHRDASELRASCHRHGFYPSQFQLLSHCTRFTAPAAPPDLSRQQPPQLQTPAQTGFLRVQRAGFLSEQLFSSAADEERKGGEQVAEYVHRAPSRDTEERTQSSRSCLHSFSLTKSTYPLPRHLPALFPGSIQKKISHFCLRMSRIGFEFDITYVGELNDSSTKRQSGS